MVLGTIDTSTRGESIMIPVGQLRLLLTKAGLEYVITRVEGNVAHVNIIVAEQPDVHS